MSSFLLLRSSLLLTAALALCSPREAAAVGCDPKTYRTIRFVTPASFTLVGCAFLPGNSLGGDQGVKYWVRNETGSKLEIEFDKVYTFSCLATETIHGTLSLAPHQEINGGYFSGDLSLGDPLFPAEKCGVKGATLSTVSLQNVKVIDRTREERLREQQEQARQAQEAARRKEEERKAREAEVRRRDEERRAAAEEQRQRQQRSAEEARQRQRAAVEQQLEFIDGLKRQQQEQADRSYSEFKSQSDRRLAGYDAERSRSEAALEAGRARSAQRQEAMEDRLEESRRSAGQSAQRVADAQRSYDDAVGDVLAGLDDPGPARTGPSGRGAPVGSALQYAGAHAADVRLLLSRSPLRWKTPSCATCKDGVPPEIPAEAPCVRDRYVHAALQYAWAAEGYARNGDAARAAEMAGRMADQLRTVASLCSDAPGLAGAPACATLAAWPCP